ncbi:hypothetical protein LSTR_LSTR015654, partial [Laodelphax striatellus]
TRHRSGHSGYGANGLVGAINLFFNRWGKIRMLLPYQPDYKTHKLKVPGTGACSAPPLARIQGWRVLLFT